MKGDFTATLKRIYKPFIWALIAIVVLFVLYVAIRVIFFSGLFFNKNEEPPVTDYYKSLAEENKAISYDEESNTLFMNQEAIVVMKVGTTLEEAEAIAEKHDATAEGVMENIGYFKFSFTNPMSYGKLTKAVKELTEEELVDDAYLNVVFMTDTEDEPVYYPDDSWNGASWSVKVPRGANWGMEAINTPGAWAYTDRMTTVRVGLIDMTPKFDHEDLTFKGYQAVFKNGNTGGYSINAYKINQYAHRHGTHVAGTIAADPNDKGVTGVMNGKGELYYSKSFMMNDSGYYEEYSTIYSWILNLDYLIDNDVCAINISMGYADDCMIFAASHGDKKAIKDIQELADVFETYLKRKIEERQRLGKSDFVICIAAGNDNNKTYYKSTKPGSSYGYTREPALADALMSSFGKPTSYSGGVDARYSNPLSAIEDEDVKSRIIVVGALQIDSAKSTSTSTAYKVCDFSNGGERVDVMAPGHQIYSCHSTYINPYTGEINDNDYEYLMGTSMAAPHVTGVAGLIFATNPNLTGPEVKNIIINTEKGRYYYNDGYSGMVQAAASVSVALFSKETRVPEMGRGTATEGIDLCFVVDTTGSMGDDIANARENMKGILTTLSEKTENYRVAIVDYRDFPTRSGCASYDYPSKVHLGFTNSVDAIQTGIDSLELGNGGDIPETVYSGLMEAVGLEWRERAKKVIIVLGDAQPLDPEPVTGYTMDDVLCALKTKKIGIDYDESDKRAILEREDSEISVFSVVTAAGSSVSAGAKEYLEKIALGTGGSYADVTESSEVADAIISSIESIELKSNNVRVDLGYMLAGKTVSIYDKKGFMFEKQVGPDGILTLEAFEEGNYTWSCNDSKLGGEIKVKPSSSRAAIREEYKMKYSVTADAIKDNKAAVIVSVIAVAGLAVAAPFATSGITGLTMKLKAKKAAKTNSSKDGKSE